MLLFTAGVAGFAVLIGAGVVGFWEAVRMCVLSFVLLAAAFLALLVRRTNRQIQQLRSGLDRHVRHIREVTGENRVELVGRTEEIADRLTEMEGTLRGGTDHRSGRDAEGDPKVLT